MGNGTKGVLLVVDMQNDFLWELRKEIFTYDTQYLTENVNRAIEYFSHLSNDIIYIRHIVPDNKLTRKLIGHTISGTEGADFYRGLSVISEHQYTTLFPDALSDKNLRHLAQARNYYDYYICGLDFCGSICQTAKGASLLSGNVTVLENCTGTRFANDKIDAARGKMIANGVRFEVL